ncbi:MAG TPA: DoxX family protein [Ktedonobacterales bacterium]|nr:DoxX family protein [Ktedonobacterales bacterium]
MSSPTPSARSSAQVSPTPQVSAGPMTLAPWQAKGIAGLRILFGLVWLIDAWFKWQPDFVNKFSDYLNGSLDGQPGWVQAWIHFWINVVNVDPHVFAHLVAIGETAIGVALILGVFMNLTNLAGVLLSLVIWTTAEGFGGPYQAGSTDIGAAVIYVLVFVGLFLSMSGLTYGLDRRLTPKLGRWGLLASGLPSGQRDRQRDSER